MIFLIAMGADYSFYVKTIETHARTFLPLNISAIGSVAKTGKARTGEVRTGEAKTGEARTGEVRFGEARTRKARTKEARTGVRSPRTKN